jgi:Peptidase C10 family/GEVED domain/Spi protease inhibitor/Viral BACON domain/Putative binding domain, N-terminal
MRRYIVFVCFALLGFGFAMGAAVPRSIAAEVARHVFLSHHPQGLAQLDVASIHVQRWQQLPVIYAVNFRQGGFVLLSADDRARPVLGVCYEGVFDEKVHVPALDWMMHEWSQQIAHIVRNDIAAIPDIAREWATWRMSAFPSSASAAPACPLPVVVAPLLATTWNQGCYYNASCPIDGGGSCGRTWTGCGATAMAQSMKYYAWPATGTGTYSYTPPSYPLQSANYGATTYLWASMPNNVTAANPAVAQLMHQCGVALDMNYGTTESTCYFSVLNDAMKKHFRYSLSTQGRSKLLYTDAQWDVVLRTELNAARIVPYNGGPHIWVCDGYQTGPDLYHMNWGWGGTYNGYYAQNSLNPGSLTFSTVSCIVGMKPMGAFEVEGDSLSFGENGFSSTFEIASDSDWTAMASAPWITVTTTSGLQGYLRNTVTVPANPGWTKRNGYVAVARGNRRDTVFVKQAGITPRLGASPNPIAEGASGGARTMTVSCDSNWVVTFADTWITYVGGAGIGNGTFNLTVASNPGMGARVGTLVLTRGSRSHTVIINQDGTSAFWCVPVLGVPTAVGASNVHLKTLTRTSSVSEGYVLAPDSTILRLDSTYAISVTFVGSVAPAIWIDWNQDGDFFDAAEAIVAPGGSWYPTFGGTKTASVTVPSTAVLGQTRMRVYVKSFPGPTTGPCATTAVGDIEDFNVYIQPTLVLPADDFVLSVDDSEALPALQWTWGQVQEAQAFTVRHEQDGQWQAMAQLDGGSDHWRGADGLPSGRYQIEAVLANGQRSRSNVVEVSALADAGQLSIVPNPVAMGSKFKLVLPDGNGPITLRVMSATGQIVQAGEVADVAECYISTEGWAAGVYLVQVRSKGRVEQLRVLVQ